MEAKAFKEIEGGWNEAFFGAIKVLLTKGTRSILLLSHIEDSEEPFEESKLMELSNIVHDCGKCELCLISEAVEEDHSRLTCASDASTT